MVSTASFSFKWVAGGQVTTGIKRAGVMPGKLRRVQRMEATVKGSPKVPAHELVLECQQRCDED